MMIISISKSCKTTEAVLSAKGERNTTSSSNSKRIKIIVGLLIASMLALLAIVLTLSVLESSPSLAIAYGANLDNSVKMTKQQSFIDSNGRLNVIGVVDNNGKVPVAVTVSLNTTENDRKSGVSSSTSITSNKMMTDPTYGNIIYPFTGAPFKFIIQPNHLVNGQAFISGIKQIPVPFYNVIRLNYSNMPSTASNKALVGTAMNIGPFDLHDVSVYASVHDRNGTQIDSVKSNTIPLIKPGQQAAFIARPDPSIAPHIYYYSCAGVSLGNAPMTPLDIGKGRSVLYDIVGVVRISDFKYNIANDSITFGVMHYNPNGGPMSLKIVKDNSGNPAAISIMMDGKAYNSKSDNGNNNNTLSIKTIDPKTVHIDLFIPSGDHTIQIKGIRSAA